MHFRTQELRTQKKRKKKKSPLREKSPDTKKVIDLGETPEEEKPKTIVVVGVDETDGTRLRYRPKWGLQWAWAFAFPPFFVLFKVTCLVQLQVSLNSPN